MTGPRTQTRLQQTHRPQGSGARPTARSVPRRFSRPRDLPLPSSCRGPRYNLAVKAGVRPTAHSVPRRLSRPRDLQLPSSCRGPRYIAFCSESAAGPLPGETRPRPHSRLGHSSRTSPNGQGRGIRLSPLPESFSQPRDLPLPCSRRARAAQPLRRAGCLEYLGSRLPVADAASPQLAGAAT